MCSYCVNVGLAVAIKQSDIIKEAAVREKKAKSAYTTQVSLSITNPFRKSQAQYRSTQIKARLLFIFFFSHRFRSQRRWVVSMLVCATPEECLHK